MLDHSQSQAVLNELKKVLKSKEIEFAEIEDYDNSESRKVSQLLTNEIFCCP